MQAKRCGIAGAVLVIFHTLVMYKIGLCTINFYITIDIHNWTRCTSTLEPVLYHTGIAGTGYRYELGRHLWQGLIGNVLEIIARQKEHVQTKFPLT